MKRAAKQAIRKTPAKKPPSLGEWNPKRDSMNDPTNIMGLKRSPDADAPVIPMSLRKPQPVESDGSPHMLGLSLIELAIFAFGLVIGLAVSRLA